jgi:hypothetical protein
MRRLITGIAATILVAGAAVAEEKPVPQENRTGLAVTLYADGFGLVKDRRKVALDVGSNIVAFEGVSAKMTPSSALVRAESGIRVLEQNFEFDLITPQTLLQRSVGKTIRVIRTHPTTGEDRVDTAEVLAAGNGTVLRIGDRIETGVPGRLVFDSIPEGLRAEPALLLEVDSAAALERELQLAYLTDGLSWRAEYVVELDPEGDALDLSAWASLSNSTGAEFADADVQLVAGDVPREIAYASGVGSTKARAMMLEAAPASSVSRETMGELHLYSLPRGVTLKNNQTKQVALLSAGGVPVVRQYLRERWISGRQPQVKSLVSSIKSAVQRPKTYLRFKNDETNHLGEPLPAGLVRVYERDSQGRIQFAGEQSVRHTATGEDVLVALGEAVDIGITYEQTDFDAVGGKNGPYETAQEIHLTNAKAESVTVRVIERFSGPAEILSESQPHEAFSGQDAEWAVDVPAGGETELTYRVRVSKPR